MVFYLGWARGFSRKNCVFFISADSQEQSVQTGLLTVCENLATCERTQFTHLLCLVLLKLNKWYQTGYLLQKINILRDPKDEYTTRHI